MAVKAVQQIMLGTICKNETQSLETLKAIKAAGYDGLELNGFMIRKTSFLVQMLTKAAGMPTGKGGNFDWKGLLSQAGLSVVSVHEDLGTIQREPGAVIREAEDFGTDKIVITGMFRFDYSDKQAVANFTEPSLDAVDHYNRYEEDIERMAEAGLNAYRFFIEWARIEPVQGQFEKKEIEHYRKVLECCRNNGIEPVVTLMYFTSPKWLIEQGGWENEQTIDFFANYCKYVIEKLGSYMHYVCAINEANMGLQIAAISERFQKQVMANMQQAMQIPWLKRQRIRKAVCRWG
jgi:sugar phosphate isomerase/epimerase